MGFKSRVWAKERPPTIQLATKSAMVGVTRPSAFDHWNTGLQAATAPAENVFSMYDMIGDDPWNPNPITAKAVSAWLATKSGQNVEFHINSPGGDMFEGIAIYNIAKQHTGNLTVKVFGIAASAASIIAMAGDEIQVGDAAFVMIHKCWCLAMGNADDFLQTAAYLEPFDAAMASVYSARTGQSEADCMAWMSQDQGEGTYFGANQAIKLGFADAMIAADQVKEDVVAKAEGKPKAALRKAELLLSAHMPRTDARMMLNEIKGKPDAALVADAKPDAGGDKIDWLGDAAALLQTISSKG